MTLSTRHWFSVGNLCVAVALSGAPHKAGASHKGPQGALNYSVYILNCVSGLRCASSSAPRGDPRRPKHGSLRHRGGMPPSSGVPQYTGAKRVTVVLDGRAGGRISGNPF